MNATAYGQTSLNGLGMVFPVSVEFEYKREDFGFSYDGPTGPGFHHQWGFTLYKRGKVAFNCEPHKIIRDSLINVDGWDEHNPFLPEVIRAMTGAAEHELSQLNSEDVFSEDDLLRFCDDN